MQTFQSPPEAIMMAHQFAGARDAVLAQVGVYGTNLGPRGRAAAGSLRVAAADLRLGLLDTLETLFELYDVTFDRALIDLALTRAESARSYLEQILQSLQEEVTAADA